MTNVGLLLHVSTVFPAFVGSKCFVDKSKGPNITQLVSLYTPTIMGDVAVENPLNVVPPNKRQIPSNIPNIDIEGIGNDDSDEYSTLKRLQRHLE